MMRSPNDREKCMKCFLCQSEVIPGEICEECGLDSWEEGDSDEVPNE
jgi:hypothetical protein